MGYLGDTNVAARWALPSDPLYPLIRRAVFTLHEEGETVYVTPQVLIEFQALATRPQGANGLGMTAAEAGAIARQIQALFPLLPDTPEVYPLWRTLVETHDVRGRQVYDARLAAVMMAYGVTHLLTLDPDHFQRFPEIAVVQPHELVVSP